MSMILPTVALDAVPAAQAVLRARISWLCHLIRIAAVVWAGWILVNVLWGWYQISPDSVARMAQGLGRALNADLSGLSYAQVVAISAVGVGLWVFDAAIAYCIWRLFGTYLQGRIFTVDAAVRMRRLGVTGLIAVLATVAWRKATLFIYTIHVHVPAAKLLFWRPLAFPGDLPRLVFCLFVLALAHIFKAAAELADDHAGIV